MHAGCVIFIGRAAHRTGFDVVAKDDHGFIWRSGPDLRDVAGWTLTGHRTTWKQVCRVCLLQGTCAPSAKRVAAAVGEGSMAVMLVHRYLAEA